MVAKGDSLAEILDSLCRLVEAQADDVLASSLMVDGDRLRPGRGHACGAARAGSPLYREQTLTTCLRLWFSLMNSSHCLAAPNIGGYTPKRNHREKDRAIERRLIGTLHL